MKVKTIIHEDFVNYKKPSMFVGTVSCNGKCWREQGLDKSICQNSGWHLSATHEVSDELIIEKYLANPITSALVFGGMEPMDQYVEVFNFICKLRVEYECKDDVVIYTGYNREEIEDKITMLSMFPNVVFKYGRYCPNQEPHYDDVLGVYLASDNQYAERIS